MPRETSVAPHPAKPSAERHPRQGESPGPQLREQLNGCYGTTFLPGQTVMELGSGKFRRLQTAEPGKTASGVNEDRSRLLVDRIKDDAVMTKKFA